MTKHAGGRPRTFKTVAQMDEAIEAYFAQCDERIVQGVTKKGDVYTVKKPMPYSMSGLAETIGISRRGLLDYNARTDEYGEEFLPAIVRARARVERNLEERMYDGIGSPRGHEFGLKNNFGWTDKINFENIVVIECQGIAAVFTAEFSRLWSILQAGGIP